MSADFQTFIVLLWVAQCLCHLGAIWDHFGGGHYISVPKAFATLTYISAAYAQIKGYFSLHHLCHWVPRDPFSWCSGYKARIFTSLSCCEIPMTKSALEQSGENWDRERKNHGIPRSPLFGRYESVYPGFLAREGFGQSFKCLCSCCWVVVLWQCFTWGRARRRKRERGG